ncbi:gephyrin-like molybdotransferase Glp [Peribacillus kribbensis]|uniref:molybdopterin molybdotransferase MoeA n=1 Tax=Peribacillus kribbensis TaxID=356658 RepID=UPI0004042DB9|nr:gephyrin-like molybdotransferase Glp [Peribacillus kribbensis]
MLEKRKPISIEEAVSRVMAINTAGSMETVSLQESLGRYLAEDITAAHDVPHFNRSPYDGFAIRSEDTSMAGNSHAVEFEVIEELGAGMVAEKRVGPFQAARIMTGTQMPEGADTVIMLELVREYEEQGRKFISVKRRQESGENVSFKGEDAKEGESLLRKGTYINPGVIAVLATFGYHSVKVAKKPVIGLFATGTELLDVAEDLQPGKIRNSNAPMIAAQAARAGAEAVYFGQLPDHLEVCYDAVKKALDKVDILITTGGVSVGDFDFMPEIYKRLEAEVLFNKVAMRPGSVTTVARLGNKILYGLSGNPSACYVGFELFVRGVIRTMLFSSSPYLRKEKAWLKEDFPKANPFARLIRSRVMIEEGRLYAQPSGLDKSSVVMSLAGANALIVLPGGTRGYKKEDEVEVFLLEDHEGSQWLK